MRRATLALFVLLFAAAAHARVHAARGAAPSNTDDWLRAYAIDVDADLTPLLGWIGDAQIAGFGDVSHGTHELFAMKLRLIALLGTRAGFRVVAMEAPYGEFAALNDYIVTGRGDPAAAIADKDYWFWDCDEMLAIVAWMRAQNAAGASPPYQIAGVDVAHPFPVIDRIVSQVPAAAAKYACFTAYRDTPYGGQCHDDVLAVRPWLAQQTTDETILHEARIVEQGEVALSTRLANRDEAMAENAEWLQQRAGKLIVWGHNEHLGRVPYAIGNPVKSFGSYLADVYGMRYFVIGSLFGSGSYNAFDATGGGSVVGPYPIDPPSSDDYTLLLRGNVIVPLRAPLPATMAAPHHVRVGGANIFSRAHPTFDVIENLPAKFDAVVSIGTSTPTALRHWWLLP